MTLETVGALGFYRTITPAISYLTTVPNTRVKNNHQTARKGAIANLTLNHLVATVSLNPFPLFLFLPKQLPCSPLITPTVSRLI
jgi:hypothetical protein